MSRVPVGALGAPLLALPLLIVGCSPSNEASPATGDAPGTNEATSSVPSGASSNAAPSAPAIRTVASSAPLKIERSEEVPGGVVQENGLTVPKGFKAEIFADNLSGPRRLTIAPGGLPGKYDVFVTESQAGRVSVLRDSNGDGKVDGRFTFLEGLNRPYGLAFHPAGWLYYANTDAVFRVPYTAGAIANKSKPQRITRLTEGGYNQHWTRNLLFSKDAKKLYVSVGSSCNTCEEEDTQRAAISEMNPDGSARRLFATGLRNPVGMALRPGSNELWTVVNERDNEGDDLPPDFLTEVRDGAFYGWPYAMTDIDGKVLPDPSFGDKSPQKVASTVAPTVPVQAHSAALGVAFYPPLKASASKAPGAFPAEYAGDAFLAYHGSWNRSAKTGYKIVRVDFQNGRPATVTDFVRGYLRDNESVWGRPVDVTVAPDGALLFSDDGGGIIWRVSYTG
jgi:glucose/arabinose dehydrogenase